MEIFKIVPLDDYNKYIEVKKAKCLEDEISELPKLLQRKVIKILDCLVESGVQLDASGSTGSLEGNVLSYILYAIKGKDRPSDWSSFALLLASCKLPREILSEKASTELKRAKRNAKKAASD